MRRILIILLLALGVVLLLGLHLREQRHARSGGAHAQFHAALSAEGFTLSDAASEDDGTLLITGTAAGSIYADEEASRLLADDLMRQAARSCLKQRKGKRPPRAVVLLRPRNDLLLTERIPDERRFEKGFFEVLVEVSVASAAPGARVASWENGVMSFESGKGGLKELIPALRQLSGGELFKDVRGIEVDGRRLKRPELYVMSAAIEAGCEPSEVLVAVIDTDAGKIICCMKPAGELPAIFPAPLHIDMPEVVDALATEEALLDAYREGAGGEAKGVYVNFDGRPQYQETSTIRLRLEEKRNIAAWGDRRFKVDDKHYGGWKYVLIHHTATEGATFQSIDEYHREVRGWEHGAGYHFIIGNGVGMDDGEIFPTPRWREQLTGSHAGGPEWNRKSIGIALVGNFEEEKPTEQQMDALVKLSHYLARRFNIPAGNFMGHRDCPVASTLCPGKNFPFEEFKTRLKKRLKVEDAR